MKQRLDELLVTLGLAETLIKARALIGAGHIRVNEQLADKAGCLFAQDVRVQVKPSCLYVSRGGLKLKGALDAFNYDPTGQICADIGASSGGFTDCLLQHGASKVYAVDVGYGQLDWKLRQDPRVVVIERFNARKITKTQIPEDIDLAVIGSSFISLTKLIPPLLPLFGEQIHLLALIKPQFELPREKVPKGGVVLDPLLHEEAINKIQLFCQKLGLNSQGVVRSPIVGPKGNSEFLIYLTLAT
ncbi:MAG: TlyA family RNA methyltransferase [Desulfocapsaceae bacterium]|nr:TlyA family RNA methyltransferase [Desulfocapsaceae bacterium]